jgi:hypothetical protein
MHPTITLILPAKLPANLPYNGSGNVTPLSWSASDGELKWNSKSTKYPWMTTWAFGTDSQANITIFQIGIYYESSDYNTWLYVNETSLDGGDSSAIQQNYPKLPQSGAYGVGSTCSYK